MTDTPQTSAAQPESLHPHPIIAPPDARRIAVNRLDATRISGMPIPDSLRYAFYAALTPMSELVAFYTTAFTAADWTVQTVELPPQPMLPMTPLIFRKAPSGAVVTLFGPFDALTRMALGSRFPALRDSLNDNDCLIVIVTGPIIDLNLDSVR